MNRKERLLATLNGKSVDRPAVSFYELNGLDEDVENLDPFNIYSDPSWFPLINLTREKTDRIVMRSIYCSSVLPEEDLKIKTEYINVSRYTTASIKIDNDKILSSRTRQDADVNTLWTIEHLLKNSDDLKTFLKIKQNNSKTLPDINSVFKAEKELGDTGIVMLDTPDPLAIAASLFEMGEYTVIAMTEKKLFHQLLEKIASVLIPNIEDAAKLLPGRLWRIYGPEYATPPYLPPYLFDEYVCRYVSPIIDIIHKSGGFARIHSHGKIKSVLDLIVKMGADAVDPVEPPPQGNVELQYVREKYGKYLVLFGNLEICDIENMPTPQFSDKIKQAIEEGTYGSGRGFVLMPSACPYGRKLTKLTLKNYEKIIEIIESIQQFTYFIFLLLKFQVIFEFRAHPDSEIQSQIERSLFIFYPKSIFFNK